MTASNDGSPEQAFLEHLELIERIIASICRRHGAGADEAEEFGSWVKLRLIEDDYAVFRKFQGRSRLSTYLTTVIHNLFRDYRIAKWGKWRPSAAARRMGATAVRLEILVRRDGRPFDEACRILRANFGVEESVEILEEILTQLPVRSPRRFESLEVVAEAGEPGAVERRVEDQRLAGVEQRVGRAMRGALERLEPEDRLLLRMHYQEGFTVAQIARTLGRPQRPLYGRMERLRKRLRQRLEREGLSREQVLSLVGWERSRLRLELAPAGGGKASEASV